jgi:tetratricopeptide (TPR) repeat protein
LAWNALYVGQTERADALMQTALDLARRIATPFCTAMASAFAASLARDQRKLELAREHAGRAIALSLEYGYPFWLAAGLFAAGWAECESGNAERGFQQINQGLQVYSQIGARVSTPYYLSYLVEAHLAAGQLDDAERAVDEALSIAALTIGVNYEPELLHLKAQIADRRGRAAECELYLQRGLEQAGRLGLRLFESRLVGTLDAVRQRAEADALKTAR